MKRQHTPKQYLEALVRNGGSRIRAAEELGVSVRALLKNLQICKDRGEDIPASPYNTDRAGEMLRQVEAAHVAAPDGYNVKGVSTLYGSEGEVKQQWVKTDADKERQAEMLIAALKRAFDDAKPIPEIRPPKATDSALLVAYPMGDPHCGMHAWGEEAGEDFDLRIFEMDLVNAARRLCRSTPRSENALILNVGDYFHTNDGSNRTPKSGHLLDVDSRFPKIVDIGVRALRAVVETALQRHTNVEVFNMRGNHDPNSAVILQAALGMYYEKNPRVNIVKSPAHFQYKEFGKNLLGFTHGDTAKLEQLGEIMAADRKEAWGRTNFHYWYTGHIHQRRVVEGRDWMAESFRTLAAKDTYAASAGYRSGRDMYAIALHEQWGEVERHRVDISQLQMMRK